MRASKTSSASSCAGGPARYAGMRLRDLCAEMHAFFREADVSTAAARAVRARAPARAGDAAARGGAPARAQQCRLCADRRGGRPHRHHHVRRLSARHRQHRAGRAARRAGQADARLSAHVREVGQPVPRLRRRDPGHLSRDRQGRRACASTPTWCASRRSPPAASWLPGADGALHQDAVGPACRT